MFSNAFGIQKNEATQQRKDKRICIFGFMATQEENNLENQERKYTPETKLPIPTEAEIRERLTTDPKIQAYFSHFTTSSVEEFIKSYCFYKGLWWEHGDMYTRHTQNEEMQWIVDAKTHLEIIQQKKLFDVQCLWRAEKLVLPGVEICYDILRWERKIFSCPFIEPISQEDVDMYIQYLSGLNIEIDFGFLYTWQDYEGIKEAYNEESEDNTFPDWYEFHNSRTGNQMLLSLPDIRGEKEDPYRKAYWEHWHEVNKEVQEANLATIDQRPFISVFDTEKMEEFISQFEDKQTQGFYKEFTYHHNYREAGEEYNKIIEMLLKSEKVIPIEAHYDFRDALKLAAEKFKVQKIIEFLPFAYEEYKFQREMGFEDEDQFGDEYHVNLRKTIVDQILEGRKQFGEPEDLNF